MTFWWNAPTSDGGSPVTSYVLCNATPPLSYTYSSNVTSAFIGSLGVNTTYSFQVAASNAIGLGPYAPFNTVTTGIRPVPVQTISVTPTKTTSNALVTWTSNTSNNIFNLTGNVLAARAFDISGTEYTTSNLKPSFPASATAGFYQNLGPFRYRIFAQPTNSVGYAPQQISTFVDNIPGSAFFQTYGTSSNSLIQFGIQNDSITAITPFTVEWWQYLTDLPSGSAPRAFSVTTNPNNVLDDSFYLSFVSSTGGGVNTTNNLKYRVGYRAIDNIVTTTIEESLGTAQSNLINTWQHVALVGTVSNGPPLVTRMRLYVGGQYIFETSSNYNLGNILQMNLGAPTGLNFNFTPFGFNGAITSFRFTKDAALYSGASLTRPTPPLFDAPSGSTEIILPFWFSNDFVDRSSNSNAVNNFMSTVNWYRAFPGLPDLSGSMVFDASPSNVSYLETNAGSFTLGPQPFSFEFYAYVDSNLPAAARLFSMTTQMGDPATEEFAWYFTQSGPSQYQYSYITKEGFNTPVTRPGSATGILSNGWHHFAMVGSNTMGQSNYIRTYVDGAFIDELKTGNNLNIYNYTSPIQKLRIGYSVNKTGSFISPFFDPNFGFKGKITNIRFTFNSIPITGFSSNTFSFTPPIISLTNVAGTQLLLTCGSIFNFAKDTRVGAPTVTNYGTTFSQTLPGGYVIYSNDDPGFTNSNGFPKTSSDITITSTATLAFVQTELQLTSQTVSCSVTRTRSGNQSNVGTQNFSNTSPSILRFHTGLLSNELSLSNGDAIRLTHQSLSGGGYVHGVTTFNGTIPTVRFITIKPEITG